MKGSHSWAVLSVPNPSASSPHQQDGTGQAGQAWSMTKAPWPAR